MKVFFTLALFIVTISANAAGIPVDSFPGIKVPAAPGCDTSKPVVSTEPIIRIRCVSCPLNPDPLLVIDGVVQEYSKLGELNPDDIESIDILKEAAATTIYGCMAAKRGVIIVTMRSATVKKSQV